MTRLRWWWLFGPGFRLACWRERALMALAWRLPRPLVYWAAIRVMTYAVANDNPAERSCIDALRSWGERGSSL